jgi:beta-D-xylosidase 4
MLTRVLRDAWGFRGYVTSDSGALENIANNHHYTNSSLNTVPVALRDGQTDVCSGDIYKSYILSALDAGLIAREDIDNALAHTFRMRFQLGLFDAPSSTPYWSLPLASVGAPETAATNLLATLESMVLLKHDGATLPIAHGKRIAVIGPHANATHSLVGNYLGQLCADNSFDCIISPFGALAAANGGAVTLTPGCPLTTNDTSGFAAAVAAATAADVVVLLLGIDSSVENEMHDRVDIDLPPIQHALAAAVAEVGKPTTIVLVHGGSVDVSAESGNPKIGAIVDSGYPGFLGGIAIAKTLLGDNDHLGGKLAMTAYPAAFIGLSNMSDMELDTGVGRGYRYYTGPPAVFPFGHGLALTTFSLALSSGPSSASLVTEATPTTTISYTVTVTNTGTRTGDEVVQAYFAPQSTPAQPKSKLIKQLFAYERVHLAPGEQALLSFTVDSATLRLVDRDSGDSVSTPGAFDIVFTNGVDQTLHSAVSVSGAEVLVARFVGA